MKDKYLLLILAALNIVVIAVMQSFASELKPFTIVGFEFALTPENAHTMVRVWRDNGVLDSVYFVTGFDYLFMVTYSSFLCLACLKVGSGMSPRTSKWFSILALLQLIAPVFDAMENLALFQTLSGSLKPVWPIVAAMCATPKFIIVVLAIVACVIGALYKLIRK